MFHSSQVQKDPHTFHVQELSLAHLVQGVGVYLCLRGKVIFGLNLCAHFFLLQ
jgi:hypothetical protein